MTSKKSLGGGVGSRQREQQTHQASGGKGHTVFQRPKGPCLGEREGEGGRTGQGKLTVGWRARGGLGQSPRAL